MCGTEGGHPELPDAEDAKARRGRKKFNSNVLEFLLRPLRILRVLCVRKSAPAFNRLESPARAVNTSVSRCPGPDTGWIGVVSWITRASSSSSRLQGSVSVKRWPAGPSAWNTRVSPPLMPSRAIRNTATRSTPSRCAPSGVGRPMPPSVSMRNWCASRNHGCPPRRSLATCASADNTRIQAGWATAPGSIGSNQRCMPPCSALYSTGCQWARCGASSNSASRAMKHEWRRRR